MAITLQQIADIAGVHKSTVDKVVHNRPGVGEKTRERIQKILEEYEYESNPLAKALNYQKKKMKIGVVLPTVDALTELKKGIDSIRQDFSSFNLEIEYHEIPYPNAKAQAECLRSLKESGVTGVVVNPIVDLTVRDAINELANKDIPVITVNSDLPDSDRLCFVGRNEKQAGKVAARMMSMFLNEKSNIAIITSRGSLKSVEEREKSFAKYIDDMAYNINIIGTLDIKENPEMAYKETKDFLIKNSDINAMFIAGGCVTDVCRAIRELDMAGKMHIVCFEKYDKILELIKTGEVSCTISGNLKNQGYTAMKILFDYIIYSKKPAEDLIYSSNEIVLLENI